MVQPTGLLDKVYLEQILFYSQTLHDLYMPNHHTSDIQVNPCLSTN